MRAFGQTGHARAPSSFRIRPKDDILTFKLLQHAVDGPQHWCANRAKIICSIIPAIGPIVRAHLAPLTEAHVLRIAVLGGGNGSFAAAGDFALGGHEVRLWRRDADLVAQQKATGSKIVVKDVSGEYNVTLALVTSEIAEAVRGAELIVCPAPAFAQGDIACALAPHLEDGQVAFLPPATFGTMIFARAAHEAGNRAKVGYAETGTLPWLTRKHGPFEVAITVRAKRLPVGVFPLTTAEHALDVIGRAFPGVIEPCGDALSGALMNAGCIIHPPLIVMNAGPISAALPTRWTPNASPCARRWAMARRISRWHITTPRRARSGCMAAARMIASTCRATGASGWC
jgi:NAD-dependent glycerol-3-phosphate dehydrogenase-like protein